MNAGQRPPRVSLLEVALAVAAFAVLSAIALTVTPQLMTPDDYAYRASIAAVADGHLLTLSTAQVRTLAAQLARSAGPATRVLTGPGPLGGSIEQWVQLPSGKWISEKNPGYPYLAAPFQVAGLVRVAPLFYGALGCLGLFAGARRWLGRFGGTAAVGLFCSSGAALMFAWRVYLPTFTEASLIAAGLGALLWALLAADAPPHRRTWAGLLGFLATEAAVFVRYTDIVVLGCLVAAVLVVRWRQPARVPPGGLGWWLGSVALFGLGLATFNEAVYGGPLKSGYQPGEITFSLSAIPANLRLMPAHLIQAMPVLVLGLAGLTVIAWRWARLRRAGGEPGRAARRDLAVGLVLAGSWFSVWSLYAAYTWTTQSGLSTAAAARFYVPAAGAIALLGASVLVRLPARAYLTAASTTALLGLGAGSFAAMLASPPPGQPPPHCNIGQPHCPATPPAWAKPLYPAAITR